MPHGITNLMRNIRKPAPVTFHDPARDGAYINPTRDIALSKRARRRTRRPGARRGQTDH